MTPQQNNTQHNITHDDEFSVTALNMVNLSITKSSIMTLLNTQHENKKILPSFAFFHFC
jgi:hypothetical protein